MATIAKHTSLPVVTMSYAWRRVKGFSVFGAVPGQGIGGGDRLSLFVLTETEFCEFDVRFDSWIVPHVQTDHVSDDEGVQVGEALVLPPKRKGRSQDHAHLASEKAEAAK